MGINDLDTPRLTVQRVLEELDEDRRDKLLRALTSYTDYGTRRTFAFPASEIAKAMQDDGFHVTTPQVQYWRTANVD